MVVRRSGDAGRDRRGSGGGAGKKPAFIKRGAAARETSQQEAAEAAKRREQAGKDNVFRFRMKVGESADIIVLDNDPNDLPHIYEHHMRNAEGVWNIFETCPKEFDNCPLCEGAAGAKPSYYAFFVSILDLRPYENRDGKRVEYSRKLLCVKAGQHAEMYRLFDAAMKKHGSIRGLQLLMRRDTDRDANIGKPIMNDEGEMYSVVSEDDLYDEFGHDAIENRDGKVVVEADGLLEPFNYEDIIGPPDADNLREVYGKSKRGGGQAGSRADAEREFENDDAGDEPATGSSRRRRDRAGTAAAPEPAAAASGRRRQRAAAPEPEPEDEEEAAPPASRTRTRTRSRPEPEEPAPVETARDRRRRGAAAAPPAPAAGGARRRGRDDDGIPFDE